MSIAIQTDGLKRTYGSFRAVDGVDLHVPAGSVFGFLGPNGAGKTTTIRLLLGLIRADHGRVELNGIDLTQARSAALSGVGAIVESPSLYPNLTGREVLRVTAHLLRLKATEIDRVLSIVDLIDAANRRVRDYSLGMRQRLAIARALMGRPKLLILDEPTNGLDPAGIADMRRLIRGLPTASGTTVFVSSHQLAEMQQMTDHCALIKSGRLVFQGRLEALMAQAPAEFLIETEAGDEVLRIARKAGLNAEVGAGEVIIRQAMDRRARASFLREIWSEGHAVSGAHLRETRLEDLFLKLTTGTEVSS